MQNGNCKDADQYDGKTGEDVSFSQFQEWYCKEHGYTQHVQESEFDEPSGSVKDQNVRHPADEGDTHCDCEEKQCFLMMDW